MTISSVIASFINEGKFWEFFLCLFVKRTMVDIVTYSFTIIAENVVHFSFIVSVIHRNV